VVNNLGLSFLLGPESLDQKLLVLRCTVLLYLISKNLLEILEEFIGKLTSAIALLAWQFILVYLFAITSEALW